MPLLTVCIHMHKHVCMYVCVCFSFHYRLKYSRSHVDRELFEVCGCVREKERERKLETERKLLSDVSIACIAPLPVPLPHFFFRPYTSLPSTLPMLHLNTVIGSSFKTNWAGMVRSFHVIVMSPVSKG